MSLPPPNHRLVNQVNSQPNHPANLRIASLSSLPSCLVSLCHVNTIANHEAYFPLPAQFALARSAVRFAYDVTT
jgi:hypothetical protein